MTNLSKLYRDYGQYNILYNQLNLPSPSTEYAWRKTKKLLQDEALRIIKKTKHEINVADVGCGNGALLIRLATSTRELAQQITYQGFEISKPFIEYAVKATKYKNLSNVSFHYFDLENDDFSEKFDIIICSEVLEHLHNPRKVLEKIKQNLKPGGFFLLSTPNSQNWLKYPFLIFKKIISQKNSREIAEFLTPKEKVHKLAELEQHIQVFSYGQLKTLLQETGFSVYQTPRSSTLFGGPFLDNHPLLFGSTVIFDWFLDIIPLPQIGWDNIFFCQKA